MLRAFSGALENRLEIVNNSLKDDCAILVTFFFAVINENHTEKNFKA